MVRSVRFWTWGLPLAILSLPVLIGSDASSDSAPFEMDGPSRPTVAEDQIYNEGSSSPLLSHSLIEGGLPTATEDAGGNIDGDALFQSTPGADEFAGTFDDDFRLSSQSPAINAGQYSALPPDIFDLDDDGDTSEPFSVDLANNRRQVDDSGGEQTVDLGAFEYTSSSTSIAHSEALPDSYLFEPPYPNPVRDVATLRFKVARTETARIVLYDLIGREAARLFDGTALPGRYYDVTLNAQSLSAGVYVARFEAGNVQRSHEIVVIK